jgi:hypothetical protein
MPKLKSKNQKKQPAKAGKKIAPIKWLTKDVYVSEVAFTPNNYKIKTDLGKERLQTSLNKFGLAGTAVVNPFSLSDMKKLGVPDLKGKKYVLIDGNSRMTEAIENGWKKITVSYPAKALSFKDFKEMSAMFDFAKAGDVDTERILGDLGKTGDFYAAWGLEPDMVKAVEKMGSKANISKDLEYPEEGTGKKNGKKAGVPDQSDTRMVQLFFTSKQEEQFRKWEEKGLKKFKVDNTTDFVYFALKSLKL